MRSKEWKRNLQILLKPNNGCRNQRNGKQSSQSETRYLQTVKTSYINNSKLISEDTETKTAMEKVQVRDAAEEKAKQTK